MQNDETEMQSNAKEMQWQPECLRGKTTKRHGATTKDTEQENDYEDKQRDDRQKVKERNAKTVTGRPTNDDKDELMTTFLVALMQERWRAVCMSVPRGPLSHISSTPDICADPFLPYCFPVSPTPPPPLFAHLWVTFLSLSTSLFTLRLFLRFQRGRISSLTGSLSYCGCLCWHTHRHTQSVALQGTETASGWNRDRQIIMTQTSQWDAVG